MPGRTNFNDVYGRVQSALSVNGLDQTEVVNWLTGGDIVQDKSLNVRILAQDIENKAIKKLLPLIDDATTSDELIELDDIKIGSLKEDIKQRRLEITEAYAQAVKEETNKQDFEFAVEELRILNPQKLGGIRSGDTRRAKVGFRVLFSDI